MDILLVEDDRDDIQSIQRSLEKISREIKVHVVADGELAIKFLSGDTPFQDRSQFPFPNLVILDIRLPKISGLEVLRWIRTKSSRRRVPVVILAASVSDEERRIAWDLQVNSFLAKVPLMQMPAILEENLRYWTSINISPGQDDKDDNAK